MATVTSAIRWSEVNWDGCRSARSSVTPSIVSAISSIRVVAAAAASWRWPHWLPSHWEPTMPATTMPQTASVTAKIRGFPLPRRACWGRSP